MAKSQSKATTAAAVKASSYTDVPQLTRGQKAARTRARNRKRIAKLAAQTNGAQPQTTNGANTDNGANVADQIMTVINKRLAGFDTTLRELTRRVMGTPEPERIATPPAPVKSPEQIARENLIAQLEASLKLAKGETDTNGAPAVPEQDTDATVLKPGDYTPQAQFMIPLLKTLDSMPGGGGNTRDVLRRLEQSVQLQKADRDRLSTGAVRWENAVMFMRQKAKIMNLLRADSPRGYWYISNEGRKFLQHAK